MFDRFLIYARAKRALSAGRFEAALGLMEQTEVRDERKAVQLRDQALGGMLRRAKKRQKEDHVDAALADVQRVLAVAPEFDGATTLLEQLQGAQKVSQEQATAAAELRQEARSAAERGDLPSARDLLKKAAAINAEHAEHQAVERFVDGREASLSADIEAAEAALRATDLPGLRRSLSRLRAIASPPARLAELHVRATTEIGKDYARRLQDAAGRGEVLDQLAADKAVFEGVLAVPKLSSSLTKLATGAADDVVRALRKGELEAAVETFDRVHPMLAAADAIGVQRDGIGALRDALLYESRGDLLHATEAMQAAAATLDAKPVQKAAARLERALEEAGRGLDRARELALEGQLLQAREELGAILEEWPTHDPVRHQMDILNQQAEERESRLQKARVLAGDARLAEASALLMGLASDADEGREARLLLKDVHRRMDLAAQGLSQVRRAVHGQTTANREGLKHCIARLDEVAKLQADLPELEELRQALVAEIDALGHLESAAEALDGRDVEATGQQLAAFEAIRPKLLHSDRLDARFQDVAERILQSADADVHGAKLTAAERWLAVVEAPSSEHPMLQSRVEAMRGSIASGKQQADAKLDAIAADSEAGAIDAAGDRLDEVRSLWADSPRLQKLESRLVAMNSHQHAADEVERLADAGAVEEAHRKLDAMPPTPGFLRTRIFDIKQGLAKAQGLEDGFLMRVDEGGEYLVLRSDSISIGNVREGKADLALLANIAGRHARIQRSMSFHGGMEDRIVAEKGEVFVNGKRVDSAALKSGDRVRLGSTLEFVYKVPAKRSLTVELQLKSGFQVGGTDKVLLMKDRGRDGRILIGRADDAHIRVPHDGAEVEVFSTADGQVRVRHAKGGDIGGKPFKGEHPVSAGALLRCGETQLVLQPYSKAQ